MLAALAFPCLRWCNVGKRQLEIVGRDYARKDGIARVTGYVLARASRSLGVARENGCAVLQARGVV
jgi:hypothetical protein